jgi:multidrug resistance efflux pump
MSGFLRRRLLPFTVWLATAGAAAWLWYGKYRGPTHGYVEGISYGIMAYEPGRIATVSVQPGQLVQAGQVIATLDNRVLDAELAVLAAERRKMEAELQATVVETNMRLGDSSRELEDSIDSSEIAAKQVRADRSVHAAELDEVEVQVEATRALVEKHMVDRLALVELSIQRAALRKQIQADDEMIRSLDGQSATVRARRGTLPRVASDQVTDALLSALETIREEEAILTRRKDLLVLRAPGAGQVTGLFLRPGEMAIEGAVVATIAGPAQTTADGRPLVYVCASETLAANVEVGEGVQLRPPEGGAVLLTAHVQWLAPEVGELPMRCWRDARIAEWGRGIYVTPDEAVELVPGQGFSIGFTGHPSPNARPATLAPPPPPVPEGLASGGVAPPEPVATSSSLRPIALPPELAARTRFEPSAIAWWPGRERYIVASDDTGLADQNEHVPWLFLMDATGRVDPEPLVIAGLAAMSDIESLALAPDGSLYVLASQSRSRKGKRPKARQVFARVELTTTGARATASVELATLLDQLGSDGLTALGLTGTELLDIEGMTPTAAGGLLLGLKGPVGAQGEALVWHLPAPDRLLATGELSAGGLVAWGSIPLTVAADGARVAAGIAELLELPDGSLLVAATAAGDEPSVQNGALYHVSSVQNGALGQPVLVRTFPGAKPEGLSRSANGDAIAVVFDAGAGAPHWTEHPWPAH